jgi:uncharacterized membrane protein
VAFQWSEGEITELPELDGQLWSKATDVNSGGIVTGTVGLPGANDTGMSSVAVIWTADAVFNLNDLVDPSNDFVLTEAVALNDRGQILCSAKDTSGGSHAVVLSILGN